MSGKVKSGRTYLTIPFFHLAFLTESNFNTKYLGLRKLIEYILDKCLEEVKNSDNAEKWIRNLEIAFTEKIYSSDPNLYINGMNVFHLACFHTQCSAFFVICETLKIGTDKIEEDRFIPWSKGYRFQINLRNIYKSAMTELTENSKETPSNIAAVFCDVDNMKYFLR